MSDFENIGWDSEGCYFDRQSLHTPRKDEEHDWHTFMEYASGRHDPNGANMDAPTPNLPYRLAHELQDYIVREAEMCDYNLGQAERDDIAYERTLHLIDQNAVDPLSLAWEGLFTWRRIYGRGVQGDR